MSEPNPPKFAAQLDSDARRTPVRVGSQTWSVDRIQIRPPAPLPIRFHVTGAADGQGAKQVQVQFLPVDRMNAPRRRHHQLHYATA